MPNDPGGAASAQYDGDAMDAYYTSMYPPLIYEYYPHIVRVVDEMDDPSTQMLPRELVEAMADRIMSRVEKAQMMQFGRDRRRDLARTLITALLIAELVRRRRCRAC